MAWMSDEQYLLMQDTRDKKITARSARHTKTHCGKSGPVKFPSDFKTKKEIKAMSGECKTYRMNEPISWDEFKELPDDLKKQYVTSIREKFDTPDSAIADMFGKNISVVSKYFKCLGLASTRSRGCKRQWDRDGFNSWRGIEEVDVEKKDLEQVDAEKVGSGVYTDGTERIVGESVDHTTPLIIPSNGSMRFEGSVDDIFRTVKLLLGSSKVVMDIRWDVVEDIGGGMNE